MPAAGECLNKRAFAIVMRKMHVRHGTVPKPEDPMDAARDQQRFDVQEVRGVPRFLADNAAERCGSRGSG